MLVALYVYIIEEKESDRLINDRGIKQNARKVCKCGCVSAG